MVNGTNVNLIREGKILLQLRDNKKGIFNPNKWGRFGGGIEKGETPEQGAIREIQEELGITLEKKKLKLLEKRNLNYLKKET